MKNPDHEGLRVWSLLIPRIEEVLNYEINPIYKCWIIRELIKLERDRGGEDENEK